jgi:hypothetical protein
VGLFTVSVKFCVALVPTPFEAVKVMLRMPAELGPGVPPSTWVTALKVIPLGSAPLSLKVGVGEPVAVTVKEPAVPTLKVVLFALVMAGAWFTASVKFCVASVPTPFEAVKTIG